MEIDAALARRLADFLDRQEVADLVMTVQATSDRWLWERLPQYLTKDCVMVTHIDGIPVLTNISKDENHFDSKVNWREATGVRGQHQWANVIVSLAGDTATAYMSGTQTNTYPDGVSETSGILQEAECVRTTEGWK